jgi:hypothetical protein
VTDTHDGKTVGRMEKIDTGGKSEFTEHGKKISINIYVRSIII